ncbi:glycoside hydrolase [Saccharobesus litoralis]|uniref:Glycoside hydrolase n=1 Tax=Saccharobesus litoralis TaxID=2172099 RepID=A0A2S0VUS0_9ALTE|nr:glycoside hydrolase [Saccharobesus litoralis]AWB67840.1 glycoside hydrolase [Saccharobesus litoralis]
MYKFPIFSLSLVGLVTACTPIASTTSNSLSVNVPSYLPSYLPEPPIGFEWRKVEVMSDEFNGTELDSSKWHNQIKTWKGRRPARFLPDNVAVNNGVLQLKTSTYAKDADGYTMGGAAVAGIHQATYGYFESRIKASKTKMSTTFWLHSDKAENPSDCDTRHSIEIDILEAIGGWPNEWWANRMHSNTHYKPTSMQNGKCRGDKYVSQGAKHNAGVKLNQDYHVYSAWWVTPNQVHFYFDGQKMGTVDLNHEIDSVPFNGPMSLRMVVETYDWQPKLIKKIAGEHQPYPTAIELDDPSINTAYYDYVRSYQLVESKANLVDNAGFEQGQLGWAMSGQAEVVHEHGASYTQALGAKLSKGKIKQQLSTKLNSPYQVNLYAKSAAQQGAVIKVIDDMGKTLVQRQVHSEQFALYTLDFNTQQSNQVTLLIEGSDGQVTYLDNISVSAI